jgi:hypothetical protein
MSHATRRDERSFGLSELPRHQDLVELGGSYSREQILGRVHAVELAVSTNALKVAATSVPRRDFDP